MMRPFIVAALLAIPAVGQTATIYLCKAYGGGEFWSSAHCHQHKALIQRIANVPDGLPFDQQVDLARHEAREGRRLLQQQPRGQADEPSRPQAATTNTVSPAEAECASLAEWSRKIDEAAARPQPAQTQDALAREKRHVRGRQAVLRCR
ncbi:MAG TPA: hypothetical protein VJN44_18820 [Roseateles sp.]|nr:hypothetical protein [Roseateles sp.]